jgi:hypothetical protein
MSRAREVFWFAFVAALVGCLLLADLLTEKWWRSANRRIRAIGRALVLAEIAGEDAKAAAERDEQ